MRQFLSRFFAYFVLSATLALCAVAQQSTPDSAPQGATASPAAGASAIPQQPEADYRIGVDDILNVSVWGETDLTRTVPVRPDGKISLPLVGDVQAAGKTTVELQGELKGAISKFVKAPEVTVILIDIRSRSVNVIGEVSRPGTFPLRQHMAVLDAIAEAGGLRDFAKKNAIYVLREDANGNRVRLPYDYRKVLDGREGAHDTELQPHDTVVVP